MEISFILFVCVFRSHFCVMWTEKVSCPNVSLQWNLVCKRLQEGKTRNQGNLRGKRQEARGKRQSKRAKRETKAILWEKKSRPVYNVLFVQYDSPVCKLCIRNLKSKNHFQADEQTSVLGHLHITSGQLGQLFHSKTILWEKTSRPACTNRTRKKKRKQPLERDFAFCSEFVSSSFLLLPQEIHASITDLQGKGIHEVLRGWKLKNEKTWRLIVHIYASYR